MPFDSLRANGLDFCERSHLLLRQPHAERRFVRLVFNLNPAVMFVKNLPANIEAVPFAHRFRMAHHEFLRKYAKLICVNFSS